MLPSKTFIAGANNSCHCTSIPPIQLISLPTSTGKSKSWEYCTVCTVVNGRSKGYISCHLSGKLLIKLFSAR